MLFGLNEGTVATPEVATKLFNESYDFVAMEQEMLAESARAWNKIEYMTGEANCRLIHESVANPEGVGALMEGVVGGFFKKVKEFFVKLKNMLVEVFSKFMMWVNSKLKSEKDFATKYEKEILEKIATLGEIEVKGFKYTLKDIKALPTANTIKIDGADAAAKSEAVEKQVAAYRGALVGKSGEVDSDDFSKELYAFFRNGEETPEDMTLKAPEVKAIFNELKSFAKTKEAIEKEKSAAEKDLNAVIKVLEASEKDIKVDTEDGAKEIADLQMLVSALKSMATNRNQAFTAKVAAVKEQADFGKKVVLAVKSAKKQNNSAVGGLFSMSI